MNGDLIERARAAVAEDAPGWDPVAWAERCGKFIYYIEQLCIELEDADDPDGRSRRMKARLSGQS